MQEHLHTPVTHIDVNPLLQHAQMPESVNLGRSHLEILFLKTSIKLILNAQNQDPKPKFIALKLPFLA